MVKAGQIGAERCRDEVAVFLHVLQRYGGWGPEGRTNRPQPLCPAGPV